MKQRLTELIFLFILCTSCTLLPSLDDEPTIITIESATEKGFPIYLPPNNMLQSMGIENPPKIIINTQDRTCTYLSIDFYYENKLDDQDGEKPAISMVVSDGCAYPAWQGYPIELSWAVGGKATRVGEDYVDELPPIILFNEPTQQFQYVVSSEESLDNTMKLIESMSLIIVQ